MSDREPRPVRLHTWRDIALASLAVVAAAVLTVVVLTGDDNRAGYEGVERFAVTAARTAD